MSTKTSAQTPAEAALSYVGLGWSVFPVGLNKKPLVPWKKYQTDRASVEDIKKWAKQFLGCGWAVVTGEISNLVVIDFETAESIRFFESTVCPLPETIISITGRASGEGRHYCFSYPKGVDLRNSEGKLKHTDFRGQGGYVVLPPSLHESGRSYAWGKINPVEHGLDDLCELPQEAIDFFCSKQKESKSYNAESRTPIPKGSRHLSLVSLAGSLRRIGLNRAEIFTVASIRNSDYCQPPLEEKDVEHIAESVSRYEPDQIATAVAENLDAFFPENRISKID